MTALIIKNTAFGLALIVLIGGLSQCSQSAYAGHLSKSNSVTPERHSGFFVPVICTDSQSVPRPCTPAPFAAAWGQSVYDGMTPQNKSAMANMWGGTVRPRVSPVTHSDSQPDWAFSHKLTGVMHHD
jgi:hypothetical protein